MREVHFEDETFRTAPQSLWATRMKTETMLGIAPTLDEAGFAVAKIGSTLFQKPGHVVSMEDPLWGFSADAGFTIIVADKIGGRTTGGGQP